MQKIFIYFVRLSYYHCIHICFCVSYYCIWQWWVHLCLLMQKIVIFCFIIFVLYMYLYLYLYFYIVFDSGGCKSVCGCKRLSYFVLSYLYCICICICICIFICIFYIVFDSGGCKSVCGCKTAQNWCKTWLLAGAYITLLYHIVWYSICIYVGKTIYLC